MTFKEKLLGNLLTFQRGFDITKAEQTEGDIPIVSSSGVSSFHNESKAAAPGVVIGRKGTLGTVHYLDRSYWPHDTTLWIKDFKGSHPRFLSYFLSTLRLENFDTGASNPTLNRNHLHKIKVIAPAPKEQEKIAAVLAVYDDLIANNQRRIALLESMAEEIYREWFVRKRVGRAGHRLTRFDELGQFVKGKNPAEIQSSPGEDLLPYLTADVLRGAPACEWVLSNRSVVSGAGEVLMLMDGSNSGEVFRGPAGVVASTVAVIRTAREHQGIVYQYLRQMQEAIKWNNTGSAVPHANKDFITRMLVPIPLNEKTMTEFNSIHEPLYQQGQALKQISARLMVQRDSLLPRLISGKLRVDALDIQFPPSMQPPAEATAQATSINQGLVHSGA